MQIILLSGGSGRRLWPLSNDVRSKQFIRIFRNENGEYESMVQRMYRQIRKVDPEAVVTIATAKSQVSAIRNQRPLFYKALIVTFVSICVSFGLRSISDRIKKCWKLDEIDESL